MQPSNLSRSNQILFTILAALIILAAIGLGYQFIRPGSAPEPTVETIAEDWPTPKTPPTPTSTGTPLATALPTETPTPLPTPTPIVIGWRELGTLISIESTLQTVVEARRDGGLLGDDRVILLAIGNVEAGVDLTQIADEDVVIDGTSVKVTLPPAQITSVELLPDETQIFDSQRRILFSEAEGLEVEALDKARSQIETWAIERGHILTQAETLAGSQLEAFLRKLGFEEIEITFKEGN